MELDTGRCYRALRTRDRRFDGRFFTAVRSTGIYCRPICPAPTPKLENCTFLPSAAAAHELGYRPCRRCRPEASPHTPAWSGTSTTVARALRLIREGALDEAGVDSLADRVGVGERHLRRLFLQHVGATPLAVAQTQRLLFAKRLIDETALPLSQVAHAAGYGSLRRFNAAFQSSYGCAPRELRKGAAAGPGARQPDAPLVLRLPFRPPLDWRGVLAYLAVRATPEVELVSAEGYRRTVSFEDTQGWIEVIRPAPKEPRLEARLHLSSPAPLTLVAERLRQLFDLDCDPGPITRQLGADPELRPYVRSSRGLRVPGAWNRFELAVRAILGQQVSVAGATTLAGRLARTYGRPLPGNGERPEGLSRIFPTPERLADADIAEIGLPRARAHAIRTLAAAICSGDVDLDSGGELEGTLTSLVSLPGIGRWTADYVALRALREPDAFPSGDLGLRRALARNGSPLSERALLERAEAWRPWRGYAAMALWRGLRSS